MPPPDATSRRPGQVEEPPLHVDIDVEEPAWHVAEQTLQLGESLLATQPRHGVQGGGHQQVRLAHLNIEPLAEPLHIDTTVSILTEVLLHGVAPLRTTLERLAVPLSSMLSRHAALLGTTLGRLAARLDTTRGRLALLLHTMVGGRLVLLRVSRGPMRLVPSVRDPPRPV